jgi:2-dehydropantoate 2-reductase
VVQRAQLVLFCVKSTDTESGAAAIKPHLGPDAVVLSLQNGVENADPLRALQSCWRARSQQPWWVGAPTTR